MTPRIGKEILVGVFLLVAQSLEAQQSPPTLGTVLSDAAYVFNRYEELTTGIDCDAWKVSESMKSTCKDELKAIGSNVQSVKPVLGRAAHAKNANLVDLFDVYAELQEVAGFLDDLSSNLNDFATINGVPYAQAGAKAQILAAHLGTLIKTRLVDQQVRLARCGMEN